MTFYNFSFNIPRFSFYTLAMKMFSLFIRKKHFIELFSLKKMSTKRKPLKTYSITPEEGLGKER